MNEDRPTADGDTHLLEFLRDRDVPCPLCGYNLRDLPTPTCPECKEPLSLTVGFHKPPIGWFIATITPGLFSGIAAALLSVPLVGSLLWGGGGPAPWPIWSVDAFGWLSGLAALTLVKYRYAFLRQPQPAQRVWAVGAWAIHVAAFCTLLAGLWLFQ